LTVYNTFYALSGTVPFFVKSVKRTKDPYLQSLEGQSFDKILCAQVIHYLSPDEFECALKTFKRLLSPEGELYLTSGTPYIEAYKNFLPAYENRLISADKYPGYIEDVRKYHPNGMNHHGGSFLFFSEDDLKKSLQDAGFRVLEIGYEEKNKSSVGIIVRHR
jgi:SAM-dependent methyltransferase